MNTELNWLLLDVRINVAAEALLPTLSCASCPAVWVEKPSPRPPPSTVNLPTAPVCVDVSSNRLGLNVEPSLMIDAVTPALAALIFVTRLASVSLDVVVIVVPSRLLI